MVGCVPACLLRKGRHDVVVDGAMDLSATSVIDVNEVTERRPGIEGQRHRRRQR